MIGELVALVFHPWVLGFLTGFALATLFGSVRLMRELRAHMETASRALVMAGCLDEAITHAKETGEWGALEPRLDERAEEEALTAALIDRQHESFVEFVYRRYWPR